MDIFKQTDSRWAGFPLGSSPYKMGEPGIGWGCTTTVVAQLLALAGWHLNPGDVVSKLNAEGGYTNSSYSSGPGLLYWRTPGVEKSFPQFHWNTGGPFHMWVGRFGVYQHWVAEYQGVFYEPITGGSYATPQDVERACGVRNLQLLYTASIDPAPESVPDPEPTTAFQPFLENLAPSQSFREEAGRVQDYLIARGFQEPVGAQRGFYGPKTQAAVDAFQKAHDIQASKNYFGYWYDLTRAAANNNLT